MESATEIDEGFRPIWARLRGHGHLWHRTQSLESLQAILRSGAIIPNEGQFSTSAPQSPGSYGWYLRAVSLFDFDTEPEPDVLARIWDSNPAGVLIRIDRQALDQARLMLPKQVNHGAHRTDARPDESSVVPVYVPKVEALYLDPVPASIFRGYILFRLQEGYLWHEVAADADPIEILSPVIAQWDADRERQKAERLARGKLNWRDVLEASQGKS
jgi:hypothetical protein